MNFIRNRKPDYKKMISEYLEMHSGNILTVAFTITMVVIVGVLYLRSHLGDVLNNEEQ